MDRRSKHVPFYQRPWFLGIGAAITLAAGVLGIFKEIWPFVQSSPPQVPNTEIVFDRSRGMEGDFPGMLKKRDGARAALDLVLRSEVLGDNLAFRAFGGSCDANYIPPTLPFSEQNAEPIRKKAGDQIPEGEATLFYAIRHAIADFKDTTRFGSGSRRIIVITGNVDGCNKQVTAITEDLARVKDGNARIALDFDFIGIGLDYAGKQQLDDLAERTGGKAHFADSYQQLENVVGGIEYERVVRAGTAVLEILQASVDRLNPVVGDLKHKDYEAAKRNLQQARDDFGRSQLPFQELGKRQTSEQYRRIYEAASKYRELQSQVISLLETMLKRKAADDPALIAKYEELSSTYNKGGEALRIQLAQLRSQVP